jgi:NADP-dependent alcohol dehydrogenase
LQWYIESGREEEKIDLAIQKTREFFESIGVKTHLSQYGIGVDKIPVIVKQLKAYGMTAIVLNFRPGKYSSSKIEEEYI